jgi:hypothetical protein
MGKVLVEASKVTCGAASPHLGSIKMTGAARLVVDGSRVLTTTSVLPPATTPPPPPPEPFPGCTNPASAGGPCTKIATMTSGAATCLKVDGEFVVLDSLQAQTDKASAVEVDSTSLGNDLLEAD